MGIPSSLVFYLGRGLGRRCGVKGGLVLILVGLTVVVISGSGVSGVPHYVGYSPG